MRVGVCRPLILCLALVFAAHHVRADGCPPAGHTKQQLLELKSREFKLTDNAQTEALAISLLPCLANSDSALRDGIAYEALAAWLRGKQISAPTAVVILGRLQPQLAAGFPDDEGFARPFSALVLAEVAGMDRIDPFMGDAQRESLLQAAIDYLGSVRDYRGFDEKEGWRHGVAHGADLLMQLALHPKIDRSDLDAILTAVASQIAPPGAHFYVYGEGERLAGPVFYVAQRKLHSTRDWQAWFAKVASPSPLKAWSDAFQSQAGLAKRHNTTAFLHALYLFLRENGDAEVQEQLREPMLEALKQLS